MHVLNSYLLLFVAISSLTAVRAQSSTRSVTVHSWPLDAPRPQQLAQISYNPVTLTSTVNKYNPPSKSYTSEDLIRVGIHDSEASDWRGVVTAAESFDEKYQQKLSLHVDENGEVWHVGISASLKPKSFPATRENGKTQEPEAFPRLVIEIVKAVPGPTPILNKPVVLTPDGKVQEKEPEKGMLQKYWWVLAVIIGLQIMATGGGEK